MASPTPRRRFQFRLRTLFLVTLIVALLTMVAKMLYDRITYREDVPPLPIRDLIIR